MNGSPYPSELPVPNEIGSPNRFAPICAGPLPGAEVLDRQVARPRRRDAALVCEIERDRQRHVPAVDQHLRRSVGGDPRDRWCPASASYPGSGRRRPHRGAPACVLVYIVGLGPLLAGVQQPTASSGGASIAPGIGTDGSVRGGGSAEPFGFGTTHASK